MKVSIIIEGGLVRGAYVDGETVEPEVFDFDLGGRDESELQELIDQIDDESPTSELGLDLATWRRDVSRALSYGDGMGA